MVNEADETVVYTAGAVQDAAGVFARPGAVAVRGGRVLAAGSVKCVVGGVPVGARRVDLAGYLIVPALVNAHAHLNLTGLGRRAFRGAFVDWLRMVMAEGVGGEEEAAGAVEAGLRESYEAGTGWVGDVTGWPVGAKGSEIGGVSYAECFGIGTGEQAGLAVLEERFGEGRLGQEALSRVGIQPHAPYSAGLAVYRAAGDLAAQCGYPVCTHLAETREEIEFVRDAGGPFADLLKELGKWDGSIQATGLHPVEWLLPELERGPWLLAHCNYVEDRHIEMLARCGASVVYCPVASGYFGHHGPGSGERHRYREMLDGGVNVCVGTDSIVCQDVSNPQPLGMLPQLRVLYRRDGTDAGQLLAMGTTNGLKAMTLDPGWATLQTGAVARLAAVGFDVGDARDPLDQVLGGDSMLRSIDLVEGS